MSMRSLALLLALALTGAPHLTAGAAPASTAEVRAQARAHVRRAETLYDLHRFAEALAEYQAAFELRPHPGLLLNIAQCLRNLDQLDGAVFTLRRYLQQAPAARDRAQVEQLIARLTAELDRRAETARGEAARAAELREARAREAEARQRAAEAEAGRLAAERDAAAARADAEAAIKARIAASVAAPRPARRRTPIYRRWWFVTGAAAVTVGAAATAYALTRDGLPDSDLGVVTLSR